MKSPLFQLIACGVVLGLMGGSVAIHALHVSGAKNLSRSQEWAPGGPRTSASGSVIAPTGAIDLGAGARRRSGSESGTTEGATLRALEEIVDRLQELKSENQNLHGQNHELQEQLKETNRDLMELQFRVDTHSQKFRPMPVSSGSFLEHTISPGTPLHPLLPPKGP